MALNDELAADVKKIFQESWTKRAGENVPEPEALRLSNDAVEFDRSTILYADLSGSTSLVNTTEWQFSAEIYKTYLLCAAKIIRSEGGSVTAYDGDRVMGVWLGPAQSCKAVRCGLKINFAVQNIVNPALVGRYPASSYKIKQVVGIDTSPIRVARTGVRGGNDLVWIGRAANFAAKLTEINREERTWITNEVFETLTVNEKTGKDGQNMWKNYTWSAQDDISIFGSTYWWPV